jgi:hypothetical protein
MWSVKTPIREEKWRLCSCITKMVGENTPVWLRVAGMTGAGALGVGGLVVQGLHVIALGPVFIVGNALASGKIALC